MRLIFSLTLFSLFACTSAPNVGQTKPGTLQTAPIRVVGYWENWKAGTSLADLIEPYTDVSYSFLTLQASPPYWLNTCTAPDCKLWDGSGIYAKGVAITETSDVIKDVKDFVTTVQGQKKQAILALGGWSDWTAIGSTANAEKIASILVNAVQKSGADGLSFDFEHLTAFADPNSAVSVPSEFANFSHMINSVRKQLDAANLKDVFLTYVTRFNAFGVTAKSPSPYGTNTNALLAPGCQTSDDGTKRIQCHYVSDNEGEVIWPLIKDSHPHVEIMSYDAGPNVTFEPQACLKTFTAGGVPKNSVLYGFEPVVQAGGSTHWLGETAAKSAIDYTKKNNFGGVLFWAVNQANQGTMPCTLASYASGAVGDCSAPTAASPDDVELNERPADWLE